MSKRKVDVIVLCEDRQHEAFILRLLTGLGYHDRRISVRRAPSAEGAAEQWVRQRYPTEVIGLRQQKWRRNLGLSVMIDADARSVDAEHQQLNEALRDAGTEARVSGECIALLVPKWEVETWIWWLLGRGEVDENDDSLKRRLGMEGRERDCQPAVAELLRLLPQSLPDTCPPSLRRACEELRRLPPRD